MAAAGVETMIANGSLAGENFRTSETLDHLRDSDPTDWLAAPPDLLSCTKRASEILFSVTAGKFGKAPLSELHTSRFDTEQIWQQIDLQAHPVLSYVRRKIRNLEKASENEFFTSLEPVEKTKGRQDGRIRSKARSRGSGLSNPGEAKALVPIFEDDEMDDDDASLDSGSEGGSLEEDDEDEDEDEDEGDDDEGNEESARKSTVEDEFFRINEMEKFLDRADADGVLGTAGEEPTKSDDSEEDEDLEDEIGDLGSDDDENGEEQGLGFEKYEDFFGKKKKEKKGVDSKKRSGDLGSDDDENGEEQGLGFEKYEDFFGKKKKKGVDSKKRTADPESSDEGNAEDEGPPEQPLSQEPVEQLSTHEKRQERLAKRIDQLEKANLGTKDWTQQGEVTARTRPINSALEVELDFEHNIRPPPVITEEVTASLEDMIRARIAEGRFDDVQHRTAMSASSTKERVEIDETKSQKGLGDVYEAEYMQTTGLSVPPTATSEALKEEARALFKGLCSRLNALSHFHYAPKPVVEDMGVRVDVPALAMEEAAPTAVSDASMLAPEEVFAGAEAMQADGELTHDDRQRRRAQKKRKRRGARKAKETERIRKRIRPTGAAPVEPQPTPGLKFGRSSFTKSSKVFAELDESKGDKRKSASANGLKSKEGPKQASFLKL